MARIDMEWFRAGLGSLIIIAVVFNTYISRRATRIGQNKAKLKMEEIIVCEGLNKYYSGVHALKDLSLKIKKDSVVGLIGDNGAGKSTLIKILSGAHQPDSGHIYFEGNKVKFKSTKEAMNFGIETIYQYSALILKCLLQEIFLLDVNKLNIMLAILV